MRTGIVALALLIGIPVAGAQAQSPFTPQTLDDLMFRCRLSAEVVNGAGLLYLHTNPRAKRNPALLRRLKLMRGDFGLMLRRCAQLHD